MNLKTAFPFLLPLAEKWASREAVKIQLEGTALSMKEKILAKSVGVAFPELVKLQLVPEIPEPDNMLLKMAAQQTEMIGPDNWGMAFGHSIYICETKMSAKLLSHEFRHVYQREQYGSFEAYIEAYLKQVLEYGYFDCPFEVDARRSERVAYHNSRAKNDDIFIIDI